MWSYFTRGSSPVDWCESNYSISPVIAEFVNTFSNILFFLFPPVLIYLFKDYGKFVNPAIHVLWVALVIVGMCSAYFHATLSLVGQLLDDLAILWVFVVAYSMFLPRKYFPVSFKRNRKVLAIAATIFGLVTTVGFMIYPWVNSIALMLLIIPTLRVMYIELKRVQCGRVYRLGMHSIAVTLMASLCWLVDRLFCDTWLSINFPYMHGIWHVLIFISVYTVLVICAYFNVSEERPELKPQLKYWPRNDYELGVSYITVKHQVKCDDNIAV